MTTSYVGCSPPHVYDKALNWPSTWSSWACRKVMLLGDVSSTDFSIRKRRNSLDFVSIRRCLYGCMLNRLFGICKPAKEQQAVEVVISGVVALYHGKAAPRGYAIPLEAHLSVFAIALSAIPQGRRQEEPQGHEGNITSRLHGFNNYKDLSQTLYPTRVKPRRLHRAHPQARRLIMPQLPRRSVPGTRASWLRTAPYPRFDPGVSNDRRV